MYVRWAMGAPLGVDRVKSYWNKGRVACDCGPRCIAWMAGVDGRGGSFYRVDGTSSLVRFSVLMTPLGLGRAGNG
jgi:hypothetical protein